MNNNLLQKIFSEIEREPSKIEKDIQIPGHGYEEVFEHLLFLYKENYIFAEPVKDETGEIIKFFVNDLTSKGKRYFNQICSSK